MRIGIIGAGAYGRAIGGILKENGHEIQYYDPAITSSQIDATTKFGEVLVIAVPSAVILDVLCEIPKDKPLIIATKGILGDKIFADFNDVMVLSGPGFADDIKLGKKIGLTITDIRIRDLMGTKYVDYDYTTDRNGVLLCGSLKNVYAILAGFEGLVRGEVEWKRFISETLDEMREVLMSNGADPETVGLFCGKGDLELTAGLPSRNYEFGLNLRRDKTAKPSKTVEGWSALRKIMNGELIIPKKAEKMNFLVELRSENGS